MRKNILFFLVALISFWILSFNTVQAGSEHNVWGWAWSESIGWISFNSLNCDPDGDGVYEGAGEGAPVKPGLLSPPPAGCPSSGSVINYGARICKAGDTESICSGKSEGDVVGYAWSENIGWINLDPQEDCPTCIPGTPEPVQVDVVGFDHKVSGWARACFVYAVLCSGAEKTPQELGGEDGWIRFNSLSGGYQVRIDDSVLPNEFYDWAWNAFDTTPGADNYGTIGWLSFNWDNCDSDRDGTTDGGNNAPPRQYLCDLGNPTKDYKVLTDFFVPSNDPPVVSDPKLTAIPNYCLGPGTGQISLGWTYNDTEGDEQQYYHLQVDILSDFGNCPKSCMDPPSSCPNCLISNVGYGSATSGQGSSQFITTIGTPDPSQFQLPYDKTVYWRVRVMAAQGGGGPCYNSGTCDETTWNGCPADCISDWAVYDGSADVPQDPDGDGILETFTTPDRAYPYPDFTFAPDYPKVGEEVIFTDISTCYTAADTEFFCKEGENYGMGNLDILFQWDFENNSEFDLEYFAEDNPEDRVPPEDIINIYDSENDFTAILRISESPFPSERICTKESDLIQVRYPTPGWKEVWPF